MGKVLPEWLYHLPAENLPIPPISHHSQADNTTLSQDAVLQFAAAFGHSHIDAVTLTPDGYFREVHAWDASDRAAQVHPAPPPRGVIITGFIT